MVLAGCKKALPPSTGVLVTAGPRKGMLLDVYVLLREQHATCKLRNILMLSDWVVRMDSHWEAIVRLALLANLDFDF
jgi:hypothetical protein